MALNIDHSSLSFLEYLSLTTRYHFKIEGEIEVKGTGELRPNYFPVSYTILKRYAILNAMHNLIQPLSLDSVQESYNSYLR